MIEVINLLNELFDPFSWEITIRNNADEVAVIYVEVEGEQLCSALDEDELLGMLNDQSTLLGF
jgi:hypothetical protein